MNRAITLLVLIVMALVIFSSPILAQTTQERSAGSKLQNPFYSGGSVAAGCSPTTSASLDDSQSTPQAFNPDPAAVEMFNNDMMPLIEPLIPLYQRAAEEAGLADWEFLPALHNLEFALRRDNPTTNLGFKTPFQMSESGLNGAGVDTSTEMFAPGHVLTDDEFVQVAKYAIEIYIFGKAAAVGVDPAKPLQPLDAAKLMVAYKSGEGSVWFEGGADINLHAYAWAGFDTTPAHKLPMPWGPGSPYGDEVAGTTLNKVGAATTFALLKDGNFGSTTCGSTGTTYTPLTGKSKEELIEMILNSQSVVFGNYQDAGPQRSDVENELTEKMLVLFAAMATQSDARVLVNALKSDHGPGTLHELGRAIDIGYYGNGHGNHNAEGDKLFKFIHDNYQALEIDELIWQEPPSGYGCIDEGIKGDCYDLYSQGVMDQHYHHIHAGVKE